MIMAKEIIVVAEILQGKVSDITYEMLGIGRKLANGTSAPLLVCVAGTDGVALAKNLGVADKVLLVEDAALSAPTPDTITSVLAGLVQQREPALVLIGGTNVSTGVGAILALRTGLPHINFSKDIKLENGTIVVTSQLFGGKILAEVEVLAAGAIVSVVPGAFPLDAGKSVRTPEVETLKLPIKASKMSFKKFIEPDTSDVDITKQDVLISVGRGIENESNLELADELAKLLGGAVCGSRPVIDQGWLPLSRQVGKSGMMVRPKLYLALGISGAPEHVEGMKNSQLIIAVNTDPKAPIFDIAQYGAVGDIFEIVPQLIEELKQRKKGV
jgi:electron transfer flavoprotein alpha subunit